MVNVDYNLYHTLVQHNDREKLFSRSESAYTKDCQYTDKQLPVSLTSDLTVGYLLITLSCSHLRRPVRYFTSPLISLVSLYTYKCIYHLDLGQKLTLDHSAVEIAEASALPSYRPTEAEVSITDNHTLARRKARVPP